MRIVFCIIVGLLFPTVVQPYSTSVRLSQWLDSAERVAVLVVQSGEVSDKGLHPLCSYKYRVEPVDVYRGGDVKILYTDATMVIGGEYLLVMNRPFSRPGEAVWGRRLGEGRHESITECSGEGSEWSLVVSEVELRPVTTIKVFSLDSKPPLRQESVTKWVQFPSWWHITASDGQVVRGVDYFDRIKIDSFGVTPFDIFNFDYVRLDYLIELLKGRSKPHDLSFGGNQD